VLTFTFAEVHLYSTAGESFDADEFPESNADTKRTAKTMSIIFLNKFLLSLEINKFKDII
jgi:hypothetical protein